MDNAKRVAVVGAGAFGTSLAMAVAKNGLDVDLWCFEEETVREINEEHENKAFLAGVKLPSNIRPDSDIVKVVSDKEFIILALPSLFLLPTVKQILAVPCIQEGEALIAVITKGFIEEKGQARFIVETLENYLPGFYKGNLVYISGPSHAEEVARGKVTGLVSASQNPKNAISFRNLLNGESLKIFPSLDVVGVQTCAAVKNVIAIAFGMLDALKEGTEYIGDNTESLLFAMGLNELLTLGTALGATHPETFTSIAGVGDLDVTCRSVYGRNRRFGREIVLKNLLDPYNSIDDLIANIHKIGYLPEGVFAAKYSVQLAEKSKVKVPLIQSVYDVLNKKINPDQAGEFFLNY